MEIKPLKRPWQKASYQKTTSTGWYNSKEWKLIRKNHLYGHDVIDGETLSHQYCIQCFKESKQRIPGHTVDHITPINEGGDKKGPLQTLCKRHNFQKTARDGNRQRKSGKLA